MSDSGVGFHQKMLDVEWEPFFFFIVFGGH